MPEIIALFAVSPWVLALARLMFGSSGGVGRTSTQSLAEELPVIDA